MRHHLSTLCPACPGLQHPPGWELLHCGKPSKAKVSWTERGLQSIPGHSQCSPTESCPSPCLHHVGLVPFPPPQSLPSLPTVSELLLSDMGPVGQCHHLTLSGTSSHRSSPYPLVWESLSFCVPLPLPHYRTIQLFSCLT